jgi:hypothetical protein
MIIFFFFLFIFPFIIIPYFFKPGQPLVQHVIDTIDSKTLTALSNVV